MLKILHTRLQQYVNRELANVQAGFSKGKGTRDQIANIPWVMDNAREFQKNICFTGYTKALYCVDHNKLENSLKKWEYRTILPASWETWMQVKEQQLEPDMEQWTCSNLGRECVKAVYCHLAYLT